MGSLTNGLERESHERKEEEEEEPILMEQTQRFCMFPIKYKQIWEMYKKAEASFWTGTVAITVLFLSLSVSELTFMFLMFALLLLL